MISCGLDPPGRDALPFLLLAVSIESVCRGVCGPFQLVLKGARGALSRFRVGRDSEAILCSRAIREALVSLANRGLKELGREGALDVMIGTGVSVRRAIGDCASRFRIDLGGPWPTGVLMNWLSRVADVGRSSNDSSSFPSP